MVVKKSKEKETETLVVEKQKNRITWERDYFKGREKYFRTMSFAEIRI